MTEDPRIPLTLIGGLAAGPSAALADRLRAGEPGTAVVHHNLRRIHEGVVTRRLQLGARDQLTVLELAHGCVSCTLRQDLLPLLRQLTRLPEVRRIVVRLDEAMEPEPVCWALEHTLVGDHPVIEDVRVDAVVAVLDRASWLADVTGDDTLAERALQASPEDERTLAQVGIAQAEFADVLVLDGDAPDAWSAAKTAAVLDRLAPTAPRLELATTTEVADVVPAGARRGEVTDMHGTLLRGEPPLVEDCGIALLTYTRTRPFHPERLHDAIDVLLDGVVRTRGRVWVASQPEMALWVESAGGGLGIGHAGHWLAADEGPEWTDVSPERRTLASLRWDPEFGDRAQELVVLTHQATPEEVSAALDAALLTDEELAAGPEAWARYPDPFGEWHEEPCDDSDNAEKAPGHEVSAADRKDEQR
ncbi:ribosome hibernation factor-recruiting GTPase MRF [Amycolatopsis albispora]|uniref:Cobalamin biosynthesis protein CobW n=1 Tax=Amycolatopsis albispora TaxID=1804986 RepID=A0A344L4U0_9PSEU|nr:GTP-binding protein [Amycolatopsis albispora]AXB43064.1 cobalamin biosynthesis protein CobW [Amycolatopsis albispora]